MENADKFVSIKEFVSLLFEKFELPLQGNSADGRHSQGNSADGEPLQGNSTDGRLFQTTISDFRKADISNAPSLVQLAHHRGWLLDQDERFCDSPLDKRTAARITHDFMRIELKLPDLTDVSGAEKLKDLYTCHTCVNHVSQIYLRGLLPAEEVEVNGETVLIFNMLKLLTKREVLHLIKLIVYKCLPTLRMP